jgi:hypothetical protein
MPRLPTRPRPLRALSIALLLGACSSPGHGSVAAPSPADAEVPQFFDGPSRFPDAPPADATADGSPSADANRDGAPSADASADGASASAPFECPAATPSTGDPCSPRYGLVCPYGESADGGAPASLCVCLQGLGMARFRCDGAFCPTHPTPGAPCTPTPEVAGIGGCRYPERQLCRCEPRLGSATDTHWTCNPSAVPAPCPDSVPTGGCQAWPAGVTCGFNGGDTVCACTKEQSGPRWVCNGMPTPDCPAGLGGNVDCSNYPPGAQCFDSGGKNACTCERQGGRSVWSCPPLNPP